MEVQAPSLNALKLIFTDLQARFELGASAGSSRKTPGGSQCTGAPTPSLAQLRVKPTQRHTLAGQ